MLGVFERLDGSGEQLPEVASEMPAAVVADVAAVEGGGKMLTDVDDFGYVAVMVAVGAAVVSAGRG